MAQKDKVKELVGRGLDSYHTKSLQQIDRINRKNKEQNHKISILTNELDNDYLTKTEEGSVVSLEHSKEGMVYLDELQGNTLVNYCTDGSKELTLNGEIDVEGTFVTTTEGVDNGLVDVVCEGNTLVNLATIKSVTLSNTGSKVISSLTFKQDTKYTLIFDVDSNSVTNESHKGIYLWFTADAITPSTVSALDLKGRKKYVMTRSDNANGWGIGCRNDLSGTVILNNILILEGDWTDREVPSYFEGMKSVGQDDTNGHKIEILSQNKNYIDLTKKTDTSNGAKIVIEDDVVTLTSIGSYSWCYNGIKLNHLKPNTKYICKGIVEGDNPQSAFRVHDFNGLMSIFFKNSLVFTTPNDVSELCLLFYISKGTACEIGETAIFRNIQLEKSENSTDYEKRQSNKKEISLNEPLRGLPKGVKDRFVKIGGKWLIERNRGIRPYQEGDLDIDDVITDMTNSEYTLTIPTYEPLEIVPELTCYDEVTHISNNSIIPCNMKIKNSGYNAIIKPSTLYTVALDTNKSGTIGMNLGGAKGTTTNNVATITTPATLADDSLRLYGKGIKGSKVRLLEGDKTNWIPSHFEGMKSSFEDKFDEVDNCYKMEILSNNKNLFKGQTFPRGNSSYEFKDGNIRVFRENTPTSWGYQYFTFDAKPNTTYTLSVKNINVINGSANINIAEGTVYNGQLISGVNYGGLKKDGKVTFTTNAYVGKDVKVAIAFYCSQEASSMGDVIYEGIQIEENSDKTDFINNKSNKIQFSSIEPLRGVGDAKDRFVFKEGRLMIERNCGVGILDGTESWRLNSTQTFENTYYIQTNKFDSNIKRKRCFCDRIPFNTIWNTDNEGVAIEGGGTISYETRVRLNKNKLVGTTSENIKQYFRDNNFKIVYPLAEPTYEEIPYELQKIILEGYENGTLFFDTNIPPTSTITYAGETPIVKSAKSNRVEVASNTTDINDNIIPYLCDMDYRIVTLELQQQLPIQTGMFKLFGGVYEMLKRDILSKRLSKSEYQYRLTDYFTVGKLTEQQVRELEDLINE